HFWRTEISVVPLIERNSRDPRESTGARFRAPYFMVYSSMLTLSCPSSKELKNDMKFSWDFSAHLIGRAKRLLLRDSPQNSIRMFSKRVQRVTRFPICETSRFWIFMWTWTEHAGGS